jgi:broad specificity phosphatase PhoE
MAEDGKTTWLYLVRHGATEANERVPYILQGSGIDLPLSSKGQCQADAVAAFLPQFPIRKVYSSNMLRARQTAETIARRLNVQSQIVDNLHECSVGVWEGLDWATIKGRFPLEHGQFMHNPAETPYLGGESYGDVLRRAKPVVTRLLAEHAGESIAVVAHNVVNRTLLSDLMGLELKRAPRINQANCCVNLIRVRAGKTELISLNAVFHLGEHHFAG